MAEHDCRYSQCSQCRRSIGDVVDRHTAKLEKQLAYFTDPHSAYDSSRGCPVCEWKEGVITKLCWTHEVYRVAEKREAKLMLALDYYATFADGMGKKARAAREVSGRGVSRQTERGVNG